jgi:hypothetical protein
MTSSALTKRPLAADPLTAIAPLLRVRPELQEICRFAARWEAEHQAEPVPVGNLRSEILVMQSAQNRHRQRATYRVNGTRDRRVLVQR